MAAYKKSFETFLERQPFVASLLLNIVFFTGVLVLIAPRYETNDDVSMNLVASGRLVADKPDEHLGFMNILLGLSLRSLYEMTRDIPWYGLFLLSVEFVALTTICRVFFRNYPNSLQFILTIFFLLVYALPCITLLQFTRTAALAALAGMIQLLFAAPRSGTMFEWFFGLFLLLLASLIRIACFPMMLVLTLPATILVLIQSSRWQRICLAGTLTVAVLLAYGSVLFDTWYYGRDPGWSGYFTYNALRSRIHDQPSYETKQRVFDAIQSVGWSPIDLIMLYDWSFADPTRYSAEKLATFLDLAGDVDRYNPEWSSLVGIFFPGEHFDYTLPVLCGFTLLCFVVIQPASRGLLAIFSLVLAIAVLCYLFKTIKLNERVAFTAMGVPVTLALAWVGIHVKVSTPTAKPHPSATTTIAWLSSPVKDSTAKPSILRRNITWILLSLSFIFLCRHVFNLYNISLSWEQDHKMVKQFFQGAASRRDLRGLWVVHASYFPYEALIYPLETHGIPDTLQLVSLASGTQTPTFRERLNKFGITDIYEAMINRSDVFYLSRQDQSILSQYLFEHYGTHLSGIAMLDAKPIYREFVIWKLVNKPLKDSRPDEKTSSK